MFIKKYLLTLPLSLGAFPLLASAHGLEATLSQDGYERTVTCTAQKAGVSLTAFHRGQVDGYLVFTALDEDLDYSPQFLVKVGVSPEGPHRVDYTGEDAALKVSYRKKNDLRAEVELPTGDSALNVWLRSNIGVFGKKERATCIEEGRAS